jgi:1,4-dihydroxy-6-naphthoate synthase
MDLKNLQLGYSSCPNDTFIFEALASQRLRTGGIGFVPFIADVEELNQRAQRQEMAITKMSFANWLKITDHYQLLDSGSALGRNCGPLVIAKKAFDFQDLPDMKVAIPGLNTTANLLLMLASPKTTNKVEMLFSDIEAAVLNGEVDAGLIIHESRFTYAAKGLTRIIDLGEWWETETGHPIPLGGIFIRRDVDEETRKSVNALIRESLEYSYTHHDEVWPYIKELAKETDDNVINSHIELYVNEFSLSLGETGRAAINMLALKAKEAGYVSGLHHDLFFIP